MRPPLGGVGCEVPISMFTWVFKAGCILRDASKMIKLRLDWDRMDYRLCTGQLNMPFTRETDCGRILFRLMVTMQDMTKAVFRTFHDCLLLHYNRYSSPKRGP